MSSEFVALFNADATQALKHYGLWHIVFPPRSQEACPVHSWTLQLPSAVQHFFNEHVLVLRWPLLAPLAILGVLIGITGGIRLMSTSNRAIWARSFLWFAAMNLTAVPCHNLLEPDPSTWKYQVWRALDVGCTAAACTAAIIASVQDIRNFKRSAPAGKASRRRATSSAAIMPGAAQLVDILGPALVAAAVAGNVQQVPWVNEVLYPGVLCACVVVVAHYVRVLYPQLVKQGGAGLRGVQLSLLGLLIAMVGLPLDAQLCSWFGSSINFAHLLFLGCDIIYLGLLLHLA